MGQNLGLKKKRPKGEISIENNASRIRLRWRYNGTRYSFNLPYAYTTENMHFGIVVAAEIKLDIMKGEFDTTLEKYQSWKPKQESKKDNIAIANQESKPHQRKYIFLHQLTNEFTHWTVHIRNIDIENSIDYLYTRKLFTKWVDVPIEQIAGKLGSETWKPTTYNRRLKYLSNFFNWMVQKQELICNPLALVTPRRNKSKKKNPRREPLTEAEICRVLDAIKNDTYCPKAARHKHSYYYPFFYFIFHTGVRNAEAIGLRVKYIDFTQNQIEISETFARTVKGSNHGARVRKGTKMENVRYLPMNKELREILLPLIVNKEPDDFVFPSPKGLSINDQMLEKRTLKPVMKLLGFGNRDLYAARHSFGTRAAQQGMPVTDIAYLMGHSNVETAIRNYIGVSKPATALPTISI